MSDAHKSSKAAFITLYVFFGGRGYATLSEAEGARAAAATCLETSE